MSTNKIDVLLGLGAVVFAAVLAWVAIPRWVSTPSNVGNVVLSPLFWPYILAGVAGLTGAALAVTSLRRRSDSATTIAPEPPPVTDNQTGFGAYLRLLIMAVILVAAMYAMPRLGMVWTSMLVFLSTALLVKTRHPRLAIICAVVLPLLLYAFFAHVAGVAIPQGDFVRLP